MIIHAEKKIYSKEVLLKTAYGFTEKAYIHLAQDASDWIIQWESKDGQEIHPGEFENALIEQELREEITRKTADIRKLVLGRAFASTVIEEISGETEENPETETEETLNDEKILKGWFKQDDPI